jgi:hypothetical protein
VALTGRPRRKNVNRRSIDRIGVLSGVLFVALELDGLGIGVAGGKAAVTLSSSPHDVAKAFDSTAGAGNLDRGVSRAPVGRRVRRLRRVARRASRRGVLAAAGRGAAWT